MMKINSSNKIILPLFLGVILLLSGCDSDIFHSRDNSKRAYDKVVDKANENSWFINLWGDDDSYNDDKFDFESYYSANVRSYNGGKYYVVKALAVPNDSRLYTEVKVVGYVSRHKHGRLKVDCLKIGSHVNVYNRDYYNDELDYIKNTEKPSSDNKE